MFRMKHHNERLADSASATLLSHGLCERWRKTAFTIPAAGIVAVDAAKNLAVYCDVRPMIAPPPGYRHTRSLKHCLADFVKWRTQCKWRGAFRVDRAEIGAGENPTVNYIENAGVKTWVRW